MGYVDIETGVGVWTARVPEGRSGDPDRVAAYATLAAAAAPLYNASLASDDPVRALELARRAVGLFPYGPELLDYALTLSTHHGDFEGAAGLLRHAERVGLGDLVAEHGDALSGAVDRWNAWVADPDRLRTDLADKPAAALGARARLALERVAAPAVVDPAPSGPVGRRPWALVGVGVAAVAVGLLIGAVAPWSVGAEDQVGPVDPPPRQEGASPDGDRLSQAGEALREGDLAASLAALRDEQGVVADVLRGEAWERAVADSDRAWRLRDYGSVSDVLGPLATHGGAPAEGLYRLAVAAHETGDDDLAHSSAAAYLGAPGAESAGGRHAQAAFIAAATASGPEAARPFARVIRERYPGTIYDNSTIRTLLTDDL